MNKRKLRRVAIVALVLVLLCNTLGVQAETGAPAVTVSSYEELVNAIDQASNLDTILIGAVIWIPEDPKPSTPSNADQTGGGDTTTDNSDHSTTTSTIDNSQHNSTTNSSSSVGGNTTNSSSVSNTDNSRSESSRMENSNNSSTVNNYYQQDKQEPATASTNASQPVNVTVPVTVSTPEAKGSNTATPEAPETTSIADKNINIEAKGVDVKLEITGDSYNISISAPEGQESQIQPVNEVSTVNASESTTEPQRSPNWIEYITVILLAVLVGLEIKDKLHKEK